MNAYGTRYAVAAALMLLAMPLCAQQLTVILQQPPPNMLNVEHLWAVQIVNPTTKPVSIRLRGRLTGQEQGLIVTGESAVLSIPPGTRRITYDDVQPATANFVRKDMESVVLRTGSLPAGDYQACVAAVDAVQGTELGKSCIQQHIEHLSPPRLIAPQNEARLNERQPVTFSWLPPVPLRGQMVRYELIIVEVIGKQAPEAAFQSNQPLFTTTVLANAFTYPPSAPQFEPDRRYAWRVVAGFDDPIPSLPSEAWTFGLLPTVPRQGGSTGGQLMPTFPSGGCISGSPREIPTPTIRVTFTSTGTFSSYTLIVYENPCGKYPRPPDDPTPAIPEQTLPPILTGQTTGAPRVPNRVITTISDISVQSQGVVNQCSAELNLAAILQPGEAAVYQIAGTQTTSGETTVVLSDPECIRYRPLDPTTNIPVMTIPCPTEPVCQLIVEEKPEPAMNGGLNPPTDRMVIPRDDYVPLRAEGADVDQVWWYCNPKQPCPETRSAEMTLLSGRVRFEWKILEGEGDFVEIGCLPEMRSTTGDQVIFKPPYVRIDSVMLTKIELSIIDDNPTQPKDETVKRVIEIRTGRPGADSTKYHIAITSAPYKLPAPSMVTGLPKGTCRAQPPSWKGPNDLVKPKVILPSVPKSDTLIFREWIVLKASDNRDPDHLIVSCKSQCTPGVKGKDYEDDVQWRWSIISGGGRFVKNNVGRHVIYEAPTTEGPVEIEVEVYNPSVMQIEDRKPDRTRFTLQIVRPGMQMEEVPLDWRPTFDATLTMTARQKIKVGGTWRDPLPHQCRIVDFHLDSVSQEPGIALNWDDSTRARRENLDLRFRKEDNVDYTLSRAPAVPAAPLYYQHAETERMIVGAATARPVVFCEDWGAYGRMAASARLYDSVPRNPVWIPRDTNGNRIADGQVHWDAKGVAGNTDIDSVPGENATRGDGYTNYEEYRGFYIRDRSHVTPAITHKDLFIYDSAGYGLGSFAASGITAYLIDRTQYSGARVVNFNNRTHHAGDQHGLKIIPWVFGDGTRGEAMGGPGLPVVVTEVRVSSALGATAMRSRVIAHELSHGCNVVHHGETDDGTVFLAGGGSCARYVVISVGGLTSGVEGCYMRYSWDNYICRNPATSVFTRTTGPAACNEVDNDYRGVFEADGIIGAILCNATAGTGVNAGPRCGGDATVGRCKRQLRVKDY